MPFVPIFPSGLHIVRFEGGLGNQMFQYAFYLSLRCRQPFAVWGFDTYGADVEHYGFELDKIFQIDSNRERGRYAWLRKLERHNVVCFSEVDECNAITYCPKVYSSLYAPHTFRGYWQSERYFKRIEKVVRRFFTFNEGIISEKTKSFSKYLAHCENAVSLHIRRGDYVNNEATQTFTLDYYDRAIDLLKSKNVVSHIIVFSDDPEWVKQNLHYDNMHIVDWNLANDSWQDMYLMAKCKHNIIANSSFSWWGAWLNPTPDKVVIAPRMWMKYEDVDSDIIPNNWIRI